MNIRCEINARRTIEEEALSSEECNWKTLVCCSWCRQCCQVWCFGGVRTSNIQTPWKRFVSCCVLPVTSCVSSLLLLLTMLTDTFLDDCRKSGRPCEETHKVCHYVRGWCQYFNVQTVWKNTRLWWNRFVRFSVCCAFYLWKFLAHMSHNAMF